MASLFERSGASAVIARGKARKKGRGKDFKGSEQFTGIDPDAGDEEEQRRRRRVRRGPVSTSGLLAGVRSPLSV